MQSATCKSITGAQTPFGWIHRDHVVPLRVHSHWVQCDIFRHGQSLFVLFANALPTGADPRAIAHSFGEIFSIHPANITHVVSDVPTPVGMCGWPLLKRIFDRFRIPIT